MAKKANDSKAAAKKEPWFKRQWNALRSWTHDMKLELKKVHWPKRDELVKACVSVLLCVAIVGVFVWVLDGLAAAVISALLRLFQH